MLTTQMYRGRSTRDPSPSLWSGFPYQNWTMGEGGIFRHDDFDRAPVMSTTATTGEYAILGGTGCTIAQSATENFGVINFTFDGTANDELSITPGGNVGAALEIDSTNKYLVAFECRIQQSTITDDVLHWFIGLSATAQATTASLVASTGALETTAPFLGFTIDPQAGATVKAIHQAASQTMVTSMPTAKTMVADTWVKLGFKYDPFEPDATKRLKWFVDGVEQSTYVTQTVAHGSTFPCDVALQPIIFAKIGSGAAASVLRMDWWRWAMSTQAG